MFLKPKFPYLAVASLSAQHFCIMVNIYTYYKKGDKMNKKGIKITENERFLSDLDGLLKIKTVRGDCGEVTKKAPLGKGINDAIEYMLRIGDSFGFKTKNLDGYCGYIEMGEGEELLGILCHLDVVSADGEWICDPFSATLIDEKIYGRGILDDKGAALLSLYAMKKVSECDIKLNKRVRLILGGDEETGAWECIKRYKETEEIPTIGFTPDGEFPVVFAEKGLLKIKISGDYSANDESFLFEGGKVVNIVPDFAKCVINNKEYTKKGIPAHASEPHKGDNAIINLGKELFKLFGSNEENPYLKLLSIASNEGFDIKLCDEPSGQLTINPSVAKADCKSGSLICDIRYPVTYKLEDFIGNIENAVNPLGFKVEVLSHDVPLYVEKDSHLVSTLRQVYENRTGDKSEPISMGGGTYAKAFPNTVAFGLIFLDSESGCHVANEFMKLSEMEKCFDILCDAIVKL